MLDRADNKVHLFYCRIYIDETDASGVVYNANYLKFAEHARTEFFETKVVNNNLSAMNVMIKKMSAEYMFPAKFGDTVEIRSRVVAFSFATITMVQQIFNAKTQVLLCEINCLMVTVKQVGETFRASSYPQDIRKQLENLL